MNFVEASIIDVQQVCEDVRRIEIAYPEHLPSYEPGSHVDVKVYVDERTETRSYSVVEQPDPRRLTIAVRRLPKGRGGSVYMHHLQAGQRLEVTLPKNHFALGLKASEVLLLAGGIGVTPIIGMARTLKAYGTPFRFAYLGRTRRAMPFLEQLLNEFEEQLIVHADDEGGAIDLSQLLQPLTSDGEVYMCGPVPMMEAVRRLWSAQRRRPERLRLETFGGAGQAAAEAFCVRVPARGIEITVPANRSMLDVLEEAGAEPLFSCRRGECGLCAVDVVSLQGEIDHRDVFFSDRQKHEGRQVCTCVSRARGVVTIELP